MTDNNYPITPPPELVEQWECEYHHMTYGPDLSMFISEKAARWGADQELEACCEWVSQWRCMVGGNRPEIGLRAARRLKPPSLKEQALCHLESFAGSIETLGMDSDLIRRALESLPDNQ